jgi:hypothetical protein
MRPRQETAALRHFNPAYDRNGSNASHRHAADVPAMSASHPITTELVRHNEPTLRATTGREQLQCPAPPLARPYSAQRGAPGPESGRGRKRPKQTS